MADSIDRTITAIPGTKVSDDQNLLSRAWYYTHVTADPVDPETVYVNNLSFWKSTDGGKSFSEIRYASWRQSRRLDRSQQQSAHDPGERRWRQHLLQRRTIVLDDPQSANRPVLSPLHRQPRSVHHLRHAAGQHEHRNPEPGQSPETSPGRIVMLRVRAKAATSPSIPMTTTFCMSVPSVRLLVAAIRLQRYDRRRDQIRLITTWPELNRGLGASEHKYRFAWTYPIVFSPHDPDTLYIGGNIVFKTTDEGQSWEADQSRPDSGRSGNAQGQRWTGQSAMRSAPKPMPPSTPSSSLLGPKAPSGQVRTMVWFI